MRWRRTRAALFSCAVLLSACGSSDPEPEASFQARFGGGPLPEETQEFVLAVHHRKSATTLGPIIADDIEELCRALPALDRAGCETALTAALLKDDLVVDGLERGRRLQNNRRWFGGLALLLFLPTLLLFERLLFPRLRLVSPQAALRLYLAREFLPHRQWAWLAAASEYRHLRLPDHEVRVVQEALLQLPLSEALHRRLMAMPEGTREPRLERDRALAALRARLDWDEAAARLFDAQRRWGRVEPSTIKALEELVAFGSTAALPALALCHHQSGVSGPSARDVRDRAIEFARKSEHDPFAASLALLLPRQARDLLEEGRADEAASNALDAINIEPTADAIGCLTDALFELHDEDTLILTASSGRNHLLYVPALLQLARRHPESSELVLSKLQKLAEGAPPPQLPLFRLAEGVLLDHDVLDQLETWLEAENTWEEYGSPDELELEVVSTSLLILSERRPLDGSLWLRLAEVQQTLRRPRRAVRTLMRAEKFAESREAARQLARAWAWQGAPARPDATDRDDRDVEAEFILQMLAGLMGRELVAVDSDGMSWSDYLVRRSTERVPAFDVVDGAAIRVFYRFDPTRATELLADFTASLRREDQSGTRLAVAVAIGASWGFGLDHAETHNMQDKLLQLVPLRVSELRDAIARLDANTLVAQRLGPSRSRENLFERRKPIHDPTQFFGRSSYLADLTGRVQRGEAFGLFGLRKVGKTSLAHRLKRHLHDSVVTYIDLQQTSCTSDSLVRAIREAFLQEWAGRFPERPLPSLPDEVDSLGCDEALRLTLSRIVDSLDQAPGHHRVVLLLDEIECVLEPAMNARTEPGERAKLWRFFQVLRGFHQSEGAARLALGVVGSNPHGLLAGRWGERENPVFQYFDLTHLAPLELSETRDMVKSIARIMGYRFLHHTLKRLVYLSGGFPLVARQLAGSAIKQLDRDRPVGPSDLNVAIEEYLDAPDCYLGELFTNYTSEEGQNLLTAIAEAPEDEADLELLTEAMAGTSSGDTPLAHTIAILGRQGLIRRTGSQLVLRAPLLRTWIRRFELRYPD